MEATLTFSLPDEAVEFRNATHGTQYRAAIDALSAIMHVVRSRLDVSDETYSTVGNLLHLLWEKTGEGWE